VCLEHEKDLCELTELLFPLLQSRISKPIEIFSHVVKECDSLLRSTSVAVDHKLMSATHCVFVTTATAHSWQFWNHAHYWKTARLVPALCKLIPAFIFLVTPNAAPAPRRVFNNIESLNSWVTVNWPFTPTNFPKQWHIWHRSRGNAILD
jgi:hypothetical protein